MNAMILFALVFGSIANAEPEIVFEPVCDRLFAEDYLDDRENCETISSEVVKLAPVVTITCHTEDSKISVSGIPSGYFKQNEKNILRQNKVLCQDSWFAVVESK
jgi:hypothetical protein